MSITTTTHLNFRGDARAALTFYQSVFGGQLVVATYGDLGMPAEAPGADQVVFGFPQGGGGFAADGVLHGAMLRTVLVGLAGTSPSTREAAVTDLFRGAGFSVRLEADMRGWLFIHFVADSGMFAQGVHSGGLAGMVGDRRALRAAFETGRELLPVLTSRGVELGRHRATLTPLRMPGPVAAALALATVLLPLARTSLGAHTDPYSSEARAILLDMELAARRTGLPSPRLDAAVRELP